MVLELLFVFLRRKMNIFILVIPRWSNVSCWNLLMEGFERLWFEKLEFLHIQLPRLLDRYVLLVSKKTSNDNYCQYQANQNNLQIWKFCVFTIISPYFNLVLLCIDSDRIPVFHSNVFNQRGKIIKYCNYWVAKNTIRKLENEI